MARDEKEAADRTAISPSGVLCFPHLWEPHAFKQKDGSMGQKDFKLILVFEEDEDLSDLKKICQVAALTKWDKDEIKSLMRKGKFTLPFRNAEDYDQYGWPFEEGRKMILPKSNTAPGIVDERAKPIMKQQDVYAGCKCRVSVYAHPYENSGNYGVTLLLNNVQKTDDGKPLSGQKADPTKEFSPVKKAGKKQDVEDDDDLPF